MTQPPSRFARACFETIPIFHGTAEGCVIDLSDNTNLWGVPPAAARVLQETSGAGIARYPSAYSKELTGKLAAYLDVSADAVTVGCGSDDVLDAALRAFGDPGDLLAMPEPSFAMIPILARANGLRVVGLPLVDGVQLDPDAFLATGAPIIYLCSPNNPTGGSLSPETIEYLVRRAPGIVILDEAYAEFAGWTGVPFTKTHDNLIVTRTMSKAFGLAGLRVGYATGHAALMRPIEKARGPYKVSILSDRAACAALADDIPWVQARVADLRTNRQRFAQAVDGLRRYGRLDSNANFMLLRVSGAELPSATVVEAALRRAGVAVRLFEDLPGVGDALRITIGPWAMMQPCLDALAAVAVPSSI